MARLRKNPASATATANHDPSTAGAKRARKNKQCPSPRTSAYRGVTRHRWTGRFEAHLWDKDTPRNHELQPQAIKKKKKGKQVYLGAYDDEEAAARAYDLAALKYWGPGTVLNFPLRSYGEELMEMERQSREEYVGSVRRKSSGFSRGVSKYRGVARHHHNGRWEARIGRVLGNKYLYLGTYATQEEAAVAYDVAAIEHRGINAVTNFDIGHYVNWHRRRRRRSLIGEDGLYDDLAETVAAAAAFHDGEQPGDGLVTTGPPVHDAPPSSALDQLLLQSPKFNEIMEQAVSAAAVSEMSNDDNSSPSPCSTSSSSPLQPSPERQSDELSGGAASSSAPCGFPDDAQTCFECDDDGMGFAFAEVDTFLFDDGELPGDDRVTRGPPVHDAPPSSALDLLLLQSSKFKEIMEQAAVTESNNDNSSPSPSPCSTSSSLPSQPSPERQSAEERSGGASASAAAARCGFPDDVQTYFECNDEGMGFAFAEVDTFLFGDLTSYAAPMFQCDMDVFPSWSVECDSNG